MKEIIKNLKEKKIVLTSQRIAILNEIRKRKSHLTVEEIYKIVKKKFPTISFATVYNTLQMLVNLREIQQLSIKRNRACYDWEIASHHHFYCFRCKKVINIGIKCPVATRGEIKGHRVEEVQAYFYGICKDCKKNRRDTS